MKVIRNELPSALEKNTALCLGYFDSLHLGHYHLIQEAKKEAKEVALLTFDVSPKKYLHQQENEALMSEEDRFRLLEKWGIHTIIILSFQQIKDCSPIYFIEHYLQVYQPSFLVVGFDYHYGKDAKGDIALLKQYFPVHVVEEQKDEHGKFSTTRIYHLIKEGKMEEVTSLLGRYYWLKGKVVHGYENGRKIGFPTANMEYDFPYLLPKKGVFAGIAKVRNQLYLAMINVGYHPTIMQVKEPRIEVHLLDFNENIYDEPIEVAFLSFLREEKKFVSMDALKEQLLHDRREVQNRLKKVQLIVEE